jgi:hypothetical protein
VFRNLAAASLVLLYGAVAVTEGGDALATSARPFTLKQVWALDATYVDRTHGVTFRYPSIWKAETQFGYHPPALTEREGRKPTAGFGYGEGGFPRGHIVGPYSSTNLEGFGIVYSAFSSANASACETEASSLSEANEHRAVTFGRRSFRNTIPVKEVCRSPIREDSTRLMRDILVISLKRIWRRHPAHWINSGLLARKSRTSSTNTSWQSLNRSG